MSAIRLCEWKTRCGGKMRLIKFSKGTAAIEVLGTDALGAAAWRRLSASDYGQAFADLAWALVQNLVTWQRPDTIEAWAKAYGEDEI